MSKFIEIISNGLPVLINLDWVETVNGTEDNKAMIFLQLGQLILLDNLIF